MVGSESTSLDDTVVDSVRRGGRDFSLTRDKLGELFH